MSVINRRAESGVDVLLVVHIANRFAGNVPHERANDGREDDFV
jgi:hypothetical protein